MCISLRFSRSMLSSFLINIRIAALAQQERLLLYSAVVNRRSGYLIATSICNAYPARASYVQDT